MTMKQHHAPIPPPRPQNTVPAILSSLPAAAISSNPPTALLPLLSPILRQRVQVLSATASSNEPWLPLLCYDDTKAAQLAKIAKSDRLDPHPISGEVEVDWDTGVEVRYRRVDEETLHALVVLKELEGLSFRHVWCENDHEGHDGGSGWRVGEVSVSHDQHADGQQWGYDNIGEAEGRFKESQLEGGGDPSLESKTQAQSQTSSNLNGGSWHTVNHPSVDQEDGNEEEEDDDAYWAQYDNTPARTPAIKRSPAPDSLRHGSVTNTTTATAESIAQAKDAEEEDAYFSQYATVQPAMDNHDPDEAKANGHVESTLGNGNNQSATTVTNGNGLFTHSHQPELSSSDLAWAQDSEPETPLTGPSNPNVDIAHPRPSSSSSSSSGSQTVARLEREAAAATAHDQSEFGIKQHISTSVKSLYRLARAAGIEREEFERLVKTEIDCLGLLEE